MKDVTQSSKVTGFFNRFKTIFTTNKVKKVKVRYLYILLAIIVGIYYYIMLPPLHYASFDLWIFLLIIVGGILIIELIADGMQSIRSSHTDGQWSWRSASIKYKLLLYPWPILLVIGVLSYLILSPVFFSDSYSKMITVNEANFSEDFPETDINQIPLVDRDTAERLGNRQLGNITNLVSQFEVAEDYTQITIDSHPYRVSPLEYAGFFRWLNNFQTGIPHYIQVDNVTGEVVLQTPEQPIKYSHSEILNRDVMRKLRFSNPFSLLIVHPLRLMMKGTHIMSLQLINVISL
ncbi:hypothetical protein ACF3NG_04520 [Aerococcaceae bacterium WGS1372]